MVSKTQKLGVVSIPVLATLSATFGVFGIAAGLIFESVLLETILNIGVILSVSVVVARISAKSFLQTGSTNVLILGLAVFEFGFSATLGGFVSSVSVAEGIAMYEMGALTSASLHFASGILTYRGGPQRTTRLRLRVVVSYTATVIFVSVLSLLALGIPSISILAETGSIYQRTVLSMTVAMLLASAYFFSRVYSRSHSPIVYWYSLGLATTSFSFLAFFLTRANGDLATWTGIGGLCLGSVYFLLSVLAAPKPLGARKSREHIG
jgi:hypothetical protein